MFVTASNPDAFKAYMTQKPVEPPKHFDSRESVQTDPDYSEGPDVVVEESKSGGD